MVLKRPDLPQPGLCVRYWSRVNSLRPFACLLGAAIAMATTLCVAQTAAQPSAQAAPAPGRPAIKLPGSQPRPAIELPDIGSPVDAVISRDDEYKLGLQVVRGLREQGQILDDPEVNDYMQSLGARIAAQTPDGQRQFQYFVVRDAAINAFALPGGFVGVNSGLVLASANEAQLAGVLAHETAHVTQRHIARSIRAQGRQGLMTAGALLAAILLGAAAGGSGDIAQGAIAIAQGSAAQAQINFTRDNEYEADRVGMGFLAAAGFDPNGMPDFFERIGRRDSLSASRIPQLLQSHPVTSIRIAESRSRAEQYPRTNTPESPSYEYARERIRVISAARDADLRPFYRARAERQALRPSDQYGESLAQLAAGQTATACATLAVLVREQPGIPMLQASLGQAQLANGDNARALETYKGALSVSPRNVPLSVRYADTLMRVGRAAEAHDLLLDLFNNVAPTPEQIRLTALAASAAGDTGDAYYYMGEFHIASGDLLLATKQLELALAAPNLSSVQRARFNARLKEIRDYLAEDRPHRQRKKETATIS